MTSRLSGGLPAAAAAPAPAAGTSTRGSSTEDSGIARVTLPQLQDMYLSMQRFPHLYCPSRSHLLVHCHLY